MTTLSVGALTATVVGPADPTRDVARIDRAQRRLAQGGIARRLEALGVGTGEWCLRRVTTSLVYGPDDPLGHFEDDWADALVAALADELRGTSPTATRAGISAPRASDLVHYRHRDDAVVDLCTSVLGGSYERAWAWRQLGLVPDAGPWSRPGDVVLELLARHPHLALRALRAAVTTYPGAPAVDRVLGTAGWLGAARTVALAAQASPSVCDLLHAGEEGSVDPLEPLRSAGRRRSRAGDPASELNGSELLAALLRSGLRPRESTLCAWAVVALADADPTALRRVGAADTVVALLEALADRPAAMRTSRTDHLVGSERADVAIDDEPEDTDHHAEPDEEEGSSDYAGLMFLHHTAESAGMPRVAEHDPRVGRRTLTWVLHRLALRLAPVSEDDPAALAFAGLAPHDAAPTGEPPDADEEIALEEAATRWREHTWAAVAATQVGRWDLGGEETVTSVVSRPGRVVAARGWMEVLLALDGVDVAVRAAGLDLDLDWVPWLGTVVRFRYE